MKKKKETFYYGKIIIIMSIMYNILFVLPAAAGAVHRRVDIIARATSFRGRSCFYASRRASPSAARPPKRERRNRLRVALARRARTHAHTHARMHARTHRLRTTRARDVPTRTVKWREPVTAEGDGAAAATAKGHRRPCRVSARDHAPSVVASAAAAASSR